MEKISNRFKKRVDEMQSKKPDSSPASFCPFMSTPDKKVSCDPSCRLFRKGKTKFSCCFQELPSMTWHLKVLCGYEDGNNKNKY